MALATHYPPPVADTPLNQLLLCLRAKVAVSAAEEAQLRATYVERRYGKHTHLVRAGEVCPYGAYIVRGVFRDYFTDDDGTEHTIRLAFDDYFAGDLHSLFNQLPAAYATQCLEEAVVLTLDKAGYDYLLAECPAFAAAFHCVRNRSQAVSLQFLANKVCKSAEQRYCDLLRENPQIFQRVSLRHIASWLGIQPESLSRLRRRLVSSAFLNPG